MSRNSGFLISEVGNIVRLLLLLQGTNAESDSIVFCFEPSKNITLNLADVYEPIC